MVYAARQPVQLDCARAGTWCWGTQKSLTPKSRFFEGLGTYKHKITTDSPEAQRYFNQGLAFYHGFNHGAAIRSFQQAAELDPKCAMAHWGIALANGPHINLPLVPPPAAELAWKELQLAQENAGPDLARSSAT